VEIPTFKGTCDPEVYLEWEMKVEQVVACYNYNEEKKIKLVFLEFEGYALVWWNQVRSDIERMKRTLINTWQDMKRIFEREIYVILLSERPSQQAPKTNSRKYECG